MNQTQKSKNHWSWIPSLYFAQGIPYVAVMTVAVIMFKRMGLSNTDIALYTSWLYLPWVIKPLWSPFIDLLKTKRLWIISMQLLIGAGFAGIAFSIPTAFYLQASLAFFWLVAFSSATHDIAADGFYMIALDEHEQSLFVGIRSTFYRIAMIAGQGVLIWIAGALEVSTGMQPVDIKVQGITEQVAAIPAVKDTTLGQSLPGEIHFYTAAADQQMMIGTIPADSAQKVIALARDYNVRNGFSSNTETKKAEEAKSQDKSMWTEYVSAPLGDFIKKHFGEKVASKKADLSGIAGNVTIVSVRLSQKPENGRDVVLNTSFDKGDKSFTLVQGERLVFNGENWNKPAFVAVQVNPNLKNASSVTFSGVSGNIPRAWSLTFFILAALFGSVFVYHRFVLPRPTGDHPAKDVTAGNILKEFVKTFSTFFQKPGIKTTLFFLLTYRIAESQLVKLASPFMLDSREMGGLGLTTSQVGLFYGTIGVIALTIGGILGGIAASKKGLKFWLWPMTLSITLPNLCYVYLSQFQPDSYFLIGITVAIEQLGYGFGFTAYMLYMIYAVMGQHKTAHYAICTAFMALGMMLPGMIAGWMEDLLGYKHFFIYVFCCTSIVFLASSMLKIDPSFGVKKEKA
jgi:PAT family beta-lactamase induction signal transducer AmpG